MTLFTCRRLPAIAVFLVFTGVTLGASQQGAPPRWWKTESISKELGLTADQSSRIEQIFESTVPELRQEWDELDRLEGKLSRMIQDDTNDEATLARQIDRVETARASASKTRSLMLMRMRKVLTPEQRVRLQDITKRREAGNSGRRQGPGPGGRSAPPSGSRPPSNQR